MPESVIAEMTWVDVAEAATRTDLCLLPLGAVEVYGPHLPLGADGIVSDHLCREVAERVSCFVAPLIPVGFSATLQEFPGTLSVSTAALRGYIEGVVHSLHRFGVRRFLFVNGHAGNVAVIADVVEQMKQTYPKTMYAQVDVWRFVIPHAASVSESPLPQGHAAEHGTSVLLAVAPELVKMERAVDNPARGGGFPEIIQYGSYRKRAPDGVLGHATKGSAGKGQIIVQRAVDRIVEFVQSEAFTLEGR
jgi:creatinine amidohydrolase